MATMTEPTVAHYQAYKPRPFTRKEREDTTILFGGLTWKHERLIQGVMQNMNYNARPLPNVARPDLEAGKELIDVGACCPTIFTTGNLVNFLKSETKQRPKEEVMNKYIYLSRQAPADRAASGSTTNPTRWLWTALGMRDFRLFLLAQDQLDQGAADGGGLEINLPAQHGPRLVHPVRRCPHGPGVHDPPL